MTHPFISIGDVNPTCRDAFKQLIGDLDQFPIASNTVIAHRGEAQHCLSDWVGQAIEKVGAAGPDSKDFSETLDLIRQRLGVPEEAFEAMM